jgi:glycosyltransferase involved in cell wall biosynthesis
MSAPLSVVIITRNAGHQLAACLESAAFVQERLVVDSGSSDDTLAVAQQHGARVIHQDWLGYGPQKQFAATQARHPWILALDADERVTPALRTSIERELAAPRHHAYEMPRRNRFLGRWLKHGEGYPDLSLRLFHRDHAHWSDDPIHEKVIADSPIGRLDGDLLHETYTTLADYLDKQNRYTTLQAEQLHARGKRAGLGKLVFNPLFRFLKFYVLRRGFLDGLPGFVHIGIGCFNSFMKYAKLRELNRRHAQRD